jgi:hypothetical protein
MDFWKGDLKTLTSFIVVKVVQQMARWHDHKMQKEKKTNKQKTLQYIPQNYQKLLFPCR